MGTARILTSFFSIKSSRKKNLYAPVWPDNCNLFPDISSRLQEASINKPTALVLIPILLLGVILAGCNFPMFGGGSGAAPTPDLTLTALFLPLVSTATPPPQASATPTEAASPTPTEAPTNTPEPPTPTPTITATLPSRPGPQSNAWLLASPPVMDGNWGDWVQNATQYGVDYVVFGKSNWEGTSDLSASYALGWDFNNFYIGVKVHDDKYVQNASGSEMWQGDGVELQLDTNLFGDFYVNTMNIDDFQMGFSPGLGSIGGAPEATLYMPRIDRRDETECADRLRCRGWSLPGGDRHPLEHLQPHPSLPGDVQRFHPVRERQR